MKADVRQRMAVSEFLVRMKQRGINMASFTNYATLSYNGGITNSNTVTGELVEVLSATKTAVSDQYGANDEITYVISIVNSGTVAVDGLTVTDDLGGYLFNEETVYPLAYQTDSLRYYVNGALQTQAAVTAGPPLSIRGIQVPAGGNTLLIYKAAVTAYAPPGQGKSITNTAVIAGANIDTPLEVTETVQAEERARLSISKAVCPASVAENGQLTYTFTIENTGNTEAGTADHVILSDVFNPILKLVSVTYNGTAWTEDAENYTYDETTGLFQTVDGQITVPAASYTQNADGTWSVTPGSAVIVITGTV